MKFKTLKENYRDHRKEEEIARSASVEDILTGLEKILSNEEIEFLSQFDPDFLEKNARDIYYYAQRPSFHLETPAYLAYEASIRKLPAKPSIRYNLRKSYKINEFDLTFNELKDICDEDQELYDHFKRIEVVIKFDTTDHYWIVLEVDLPPEIQRKERAAARKIPKTLTPAQKALLRMLKNNIESNLEEFPEYYEDYGIEDIKDEAWQVFDESDIEIPATYIRSKGGDPYNVNEDIVESYFKDRIWNQLFKDEVVKIYKN